MPITFVPDAGDVLMCDFTTGFQPPEMVKVKSRLLLEGRDHEFRPRSYHFLDEIESVWAKADMVTCVGKHRLNRVKLNGKYSRVCIRRDDLLAIWKAALYTMGMQDWREVGENMVVSAKEIGAPYSSGG